MGLLDSVLCSPLGFYCTPPLNPLLPVGWLGSTLKSRVYSAKQKYITICCSKWSYAVTQMSQTEMRWCMVTAVQASGGGVMVSGPFNWNTVGFLMAIEQCLYTSAPLNIASRLSHSFHSCTPKGMMGILSKIMAPAVVTELSRYAWCKTQSGEITLMTWTPQSPDRSLFRIHSDAASVEKSIYVSTFSSSMKHWCLSGLHSIPRTWQVPCWVTAIRTCGSCY